MSIKDCLTSRYLTPTPLLSASPSDGRRRVLPCEADHSLTGGLTMAAPTTSHKLGAEALGTFWLVLGGVGTAVLAGGEGGRHAGHRPRVRPHRLLTGAYAFGHISGGHFNPAVTVGLATAKRFAWKDAPGYFAAQLVGATIAGGVLYIIADRRRRLRRISQRLRHQRLRRPLAGRLQPAGGHHHRDRADGVLPLRDLRRHRQARGGWLRRHRDRPGADADPPDLDPDRRHLGQPGPLARRRLVRRRRPPRRRCGSSSSRRSSARRSPASPTR